MSALRHVALIGVLVCVAYGGTALASEGGGNPARGSYHGLRLLGFSPEEAARVQSELAAMVGAARNLELVRTETDTAEKCQADISCHCREARSAGARYALWGNIGRLGQLHTIELSLLDAQDCALSNTAYASEILPDEALPSRFGALLGKVLTPKEQVSEAAAKVVLPQERTPAVVTVITAEQMRRFGITRVEELFRLVPGFEAMETNTRTSILHEGMLGTVVFLLDGVPLSHALFNVLFFGEDLRLNLNLLDRVEFVRGPASVLWGPYALLGVVNFVTVSGQTEKVQTVVETRAGTHDTQELFASVSQRRPGVAFWGGVTFDRTRGPTLYVSDSSFGQDADGNPVFGNSGFTQNEPDRAIQAHGAIQLLERLTLSFDHSQFFAPYEISPDGSLLAPHTPAYWRRSVDVYSAAWEDHLTPELRYRLSAAQVSHLIEESFVIEPASPVDPTGLRYLQGNLAEPLVSRHLEARLHHETDLGFGTSAAVVGAEYLGQHMPDTFATLLPLYDTPGAPVLDISHRDFHTLAAFGQEELGLGPYFALAGGLRYEYRAPFVAFLGKQAAIIAHGPSATTAKLVYSEGFRPPETNDLFSTQGVEGDPRLRPEKSRALALELGGELAGFSARASGSAGQLFDLIVLDPDAADPGFDSRPVNRARINYLSAQTELSTHHERWDLYASYAYKALSESEKIGSGIAVAPHTASLAASVRPVQDVTVFASGYWVSARTVALLTAAGVHPVAVPDTFGLDGGVRVSNLFDRLALEVLLRNPLGLKQEVPYRLEGIPNMLIERRLDQELTLGLRLTL